MFSRLPSITRDWIPNKHEDQYTGFLNKDKHAKNRGCQENCLECHVQCHEHGDRGQRNSEQNSTGYNIIPQNTSKSS